MRRKKTGSNLQGSDNHQMGDTSVDSEKSKDFRAMTKKVFLS
jgi:hypothetical protein